MRAGVILHGFHVARRIVNLNGVFRQVALLLLRGVYFGAQRGEICLGDVAGEEHGLRGEQEKFAHDLFLLVAQRERRGGFAGVEMRKQFFDDRHLGLRSLVAGAHAFLQPVAPFFQRGDVGEDEFGVDDFDVAHRIDRAADVMNVRVLETAHDLHDRIDFADVAEELIAESLALARAFDQAGDVHELDRGGHEFLEPESFDSTARRASGTVTMPWFGSIVQNG